MSGHLSQSGAISSYLVYPTNTNNIKNAIHGNEEKKRSKGNIIKKSCLHGVPINTHLPTVLEIAVILCEVELLGPLKSAVSWSGDCGED